MIKRFYKAIDPELGRNLLRFASHSRTGDIFRCNGFNYELHQVHFHLHEKENNISVYYRVKGAIIRIANHWSSALIQKPEYNKGPIRGRRNSLTCMIDNAKEINYTFRNFPVNVLCGIMEKEI